MYHHPLQVQLQGLQPSTIYRVSVRTKHPKAVLEQRPVERCLDFKTLPKSEFPIRFVRFCFCSSVLGEYANPSP